MLSLVELTASVAPAKAKPLLFAMPVWNGAVPLQVGVNPFQSMQPVLSIARLASAASKPEASAIEPSAPQPVIEGSPTAPESADERLRRACRATREKDVREARARERESRWFELTALPAV